MSLLSGLANKRRQNLETLRASIVEPHDSKINSKVGTDIHQQKKQKTEQNIQDIQEKETETGLERINDSYSEGSTQTTQRKISETADLKGKLEAQLNDLDKKTESAIKRLLRQRIINSKSDE